MTLALVADIGGTHARFALADETGIRNDVILKAASYKGLVDAAKTYLASQTEKPTIGAFDIAGPVMGTGTYELTNIAWSFTLDETKQALGLSDLVIINDFHALALGIQKADPARMQKIGGGVANPHGNIGVIGPGTGLGVGSLIWDEKNNRYMAIPCEGGHVTAPAVTAREFSFIEYLLKNKYSHVSAERVCSGKGLVNLYDTIRGVDGLSLPDLEPEAITAQALKGDAVCKEALDTMLAFLGRIAGNLALTNTTTGGMYFAGGILPRIGIDYLNTSPLRGQFIAKGRNSVFMDGVPTIMIDDPLLAFKGLYMYVSGA